MAPHRSRSRPTAAGTYTNAAAGTAARPDSASLKPTAYQEPMPSSNEPAEQKHEDKQGQRQARPSSLSAPRKLQPQHACAHAPGMLSAVAPSWLRFAAVAVEMSPSAASVMALDAAFISAVPSPAAGGAR